MESDEIIKILKKAFNPYRCEFYFPDFGSEMSFRVFNDKNETIITKKEETGWRFSHTELDSIIRRTKKEIKDMGYVID